MTNNPTPTPDDDLRRRMRETQAQVEQAISEAKMFRLDSQLADIDATALDDQPLGLNPAKVRQLITDAIDGLSERDRAERIAHCRLRNQHGVRMYPDGDLLEYRWGGRRLALVHRDLLTGDGPLEVDRSFVRDEEDDGKA